MEPVLHGREAPRRALSLGLEAALAGRGRVAVVSGEAGIGKSAIVAALAAEAQARGAIVTWGRAWEFADAPPYFPVRPCLATLGVSVADGAARTSDDGAFQLWEKVAEALARDAAKTPCVWVLEDLHAADLGTLDLLTFLAQPLKAMRALVVVTVRSGDPRLTDRLLQRLGRMARDGLDLRLEPLGERDVAAITLETLGRAAPEAAVRRLVELTGGNPLFVVECARAFKAAGGVEGTLGSLPPTVRQVVLERVELLPSPTRRALASGAVLGREFTAATVARMDRSLPARAIDALLPAIRAGLVKEPRPGQFVFSHALVRDAIDVALGAEERASLHAEAARALASLGEGADVLVERARHALAALPTGDAGATLALADRATDLLERAGADDRAFELHARVDEARRAGLVPAASGERRLHIARIARAAGRSQAARSLCDEAVSVARATDDAELLARAALLRAADVRMAVVDRSDVALLEEALPRLGDRASPLACRVLGRLATALVPAPDPDVPRAMAHEALRRAKATGDDAAILDVLDVGIWALFYGPIEERVAWTHERLERALAASDVPKALGAHEWLAFLHVERGDYDAFDAQVAVMLALADEIGHPRYRWRPLLVAAGRATALGRFAEADCYVTEVTALAALVDDPALPFALAMHEVERLRIQRLDDRVPAALAALAAVTPHAPAALQMATCVAASCWARARDVERTRAYVGEVRAALPATQHDRSTACFLGEIWAVAGDDAERRAVRAILARSGTRDISGGYGSFHYLGSVVRLIALLDLGLGDLAAAEAGLREALALATARRQAPWVAQVSFELAGVLARRGGEAEARALSASSAALARELGMIGLLGSANAAESTAEVAPPDIEIEKEGEVYRVARGATAVRVRDSRGMQLLARLVERPGEEVHVLALSSDEGVALGESDAGEVIDERARIAYQKRFAAIDAEVAEAEARADAGRLARLRREREALASELGRAVGLGGRARKSASATERARVNVQRRVKDAIARIAEVDAALGRFFDESVSTGVFCSFRPR